MRRRRGSCPPEDCGGPHGYTELLQALADPRHPEHDAMSVWVGDRLRPFEREVTSRRVHDAVGVVPESVRLLLDLLADGVELTPGSPRRGPRSPGSATRLVPAGAACLDRG